MPLNSVVHQLLTGRKRKAHHIGTIPCTDDSTHRLNIDGCVGKTSASSSRKSVSSFLAPQKNENDSRWQMRFRHRYIQRYRRYERFEHQKPRVSIQAFENWSGSDIHHGTSTKEDNSRYDSNEDDGMKFYENRRLRSQQVQKMRTGTRMKNLSKSVDSQDDKCSVHALIETFLDQRHGTRKRPSKASIHPCPSSFEDRRILSVLLLGLCALSSLTEWLDKKQEEDILRKSSIVKDMVLWMKQREALHIAHTSAAIAHKHRDALTQLAKFHESIEGSHRTSLDFLSRHDDNDEERQGSERQTKRQNKNRSQTTPQAQGLFRAFRLPVPNRQNNHNIEDRDINVRNKKICEDLIPNKNEDTRNEEHSYLLTHQLDLKDHRIIDTDTIIDPNVRVSETNKTEIEISEEKYQTNVTYHSSISSSEKRRQEKNIQDHQPKKSSVGQSIAEIHPEHDRFSSPQMQVRKESEEVIKKSGKNKSVADINGYNSCDDKKKISQPISLPSMIHIDPLGITSPSKDDEDYFLMSPATDSPIDIPSSTAKTSSSEMNIGRKKEQRQCLKKEIKESENLPDLLPQRTSRDQSEFDVICISEERTNHEENIFDNSNYSVVLPSIQIKENHSSHHSSIVGTFLPMLPKEKSEKQVTGVSNMKADTSDLGCPKEFPLSRTSAIQPMKSYIRNDCDSAMFSALSGTTTNETAKPYQEQTTKSTDRINSTEDNSVHRTTTSCPPKFKLSCLYSEKNSVAEESNHVRFDNEDNDRESGQNSPSDDVSEILLSQSQMLPLNSRRVTTSPRSFPSRNYNKVHEHYEHYSKAFMIQDESRYQEAANDSFRKTPKEQKPLGWNRSHELQTESISRDWTSHCTKRPISLKQTCILSSTNRWVSNERAKNFVKSQLSSKTAAALVATVKATSSSSHKQEYIKLFTRRDGVDDTAHTLNKTIGQNYKFDRSESKQGVSSKIVAIELKKEKSERKTSTRGFIRSNTSKLEITKAPVFGNMRRTAAVNDRDNDSDGVSISVVDKRGETDELKDNFKYEEVVRGKMAREALKCYECEECAAFFDKAVLHGDGADCYNREELLSCSRHRGRHTPPSTPQDYWELSFVDEREARLRKHGDDY